MEPFSAGSGESLSDMAERCLSINQKSERNVHLSNLTAKYNSSRTGLQFSRNEVAPIQKSMGDCNDISSKFIESSSTSEQSKSRLVPSVNSNILSSEDDSSDNDLQGMSLAALVAKHKMSRSTVNEHVSNDSSVQNKKKEFNSDSSSDGEEASLFALASKYQSIRLSGSNPNATGLSITSTEFSTLKNSPDSKTEILSNNISKKFLQSTSVQDNRMYNLDKFGDQSKEKITPKFIAATFCSDSDSDEPMLLTDLVVEHKETTKVAKTQSSSDLKPRELTVVASSHRYHTKSESDSFSPASYSVSNSFKKCIENETSTSLGSLKGGIESGKDFQFSLGCSIPNSFKSKHIGCGLTSSLRSLKMEGLQTLTKNSYSDPDVSTKSTEYPTTAQRPVFNREKYYPFPNEKSPTDDIDIGFEGINLSSAIKTPSISKSSEYTIYQVNIVDEPQEVPIVSLLDHVIVDDEMNEDEKENFKDKREEECSYDVSYILKEKVKLQTKKCSSFGKVVCRQWKPRKIPYIRKEKSHTSVIPFKFLTLSPDDEIASFLKKT